MYLLYSMLLALGLAITSPYWAWQMLRHGKYRAGLLQRLGFLPARVRTAHRKCIWIHAVSVGEVLAVSELARGLQEQQREYRLVFSTTTETGQKLAASRFGAENVFYFPLDLGFSLRRTFAALRPDLIVVAETEFWPNFFRIAAEAETRLAVVNARISDRSFRGYRQWRRLLRGVLFNVDVFLTQTPEDARRLIEIGAPAERVRVTGNLKFDVPSPRFSSIVEQVRGALEQFGTGPTLVCGSTVEGEEKMLLAAFQTVLAKWPASVMILAPRHPERFDEVAQLLANSGMRFQKRSQWHGGSLNGDVLLVDSIGELSGLYALADIAFVGGSLVPRGGHNIIEPAQHAVPIIVGQHTENFRDILSLFRAHNAVRVVDPKELSAALLTLLENEGERHDLARRATEVLESQRGATQRTIDELKALLDPRPREVQPA